MVTMQQLCDNLITDAGIAGVRKYLKQQYNGGRGVSYRESCPYRKGHRA